MATLKIRIQSLEDAKQGMPVIEGLDSPEQLKQYPFVTAVIMEGGMQSGATSVMFVMQRDGEEKAVYGEISGKLLEMLYATYKGAQSRWGQPVGNGSNLSN